MKKELFLFVALFFYYVFCYGQSQEIGELQRSLLQTSDSFSYVNSLNKLGMLLYEKNIDSTFYYTKQAREIATRLHYGQGKADALNNLGVIYDIKGNIQLALRYYNEAYTGYIAIRDSSNIEQTLMNIAMVYKEIGKDKKATDNFNAAISIGRKLNKDSIMGMVIYNFLLEYPDNFNSDSISFYISKAKAIALKYNDKRLQIALEQLIADEDIRHNRRDEGLTLLKRAIANTINSGLYYASLDMLIDMGDQLRDSHPADAVGYYMQALTIADEKAYLIYSQIVTKRLYDFYIARNDNTKALDYSRQLIRLHDEQDSLNNASGVDYIDYALKEQELEASRLRSKYQVGFLILAGALCVMAFVIIIVLWKNWKNATERLKLQKENAEKTQLLNGLLQSMPLVIYRVNSDGLITLSVGTALRLLGIQDNAVVGRNAFEMMPNVTEYLRSAMAGETNQFVTSDHFANREVHLQHFVSGDPFNEGGLLGFGLDITAIKVAEKEVLKAHLELEQQAVHLEELNTFKDKILAIISHDLRSPLATLVALLSMSESDMTAEEWATAQKDISRQVQSVSELIDTLLRWASGSFYKKYIRETELLNIYEIALHTVELLRNTTDRKHIQVFNTVPLSLQAMGNYDHISIVIRNLIANAIKFTPVHGNITISGHVHNGTAEISIIDTGVGMTPQQVAKLFTHSHQSTYGTSGEKGTGLGLLLCKDYIEANKGHITVSSELGKGSAFTVTLPIA